MKKHDHSQVIPRSTKTRHSVRDAVWPNLKQSSETEIQDFLDLHRYRSVISEPEDFAGLIGALRSAQSCNQTVRAIGSHWSLSEAAIPRPPGQTGPVWSGRVIKTDKLNKLLSAPTNAPKPDAVREAYYRYPERHNALQALVDNVPRLAGRHFVEVEAGIKIKDLLPILKAFGLALPTMGAGGGQSLIGALATASHGGDFSTPLLFDWIHAVHIVGPEMSYWFTGDAGKHDPHQIHFPSPWTQAAVHDLPVLRASLPRDLSRLSDAELDALSQWYGLHLYIPPPPDFVSLIVPGRFANSTQRKLRALVATITKDIRALPAMERQRLERLLYQVVSAIRYERWSRDRGHTQYTEGLEAARVAVGTLGVAYSVIIEVVKEYSLIEANSRVEFNTLMNELQESSWHHERPAKHPEGVTTKSSKIFSWEFRGFDTPKFRKLIPISDVIEMLRSDNLKLAKAGKKGPFRAGVPRYQGKNLPLHHLNIAINLAAPEECWVSRRWRTRDEITPLIAPPQSDAVLSVDGKPIIEKYMTFKEAVDSILPNTYAIVNEYIEDSNKIEEKSNVSKIFVEELKEFSKNDLGDWLRKRIVDPSYAGKIPPKIHLATNLGRVAIFGLRVLSFLGGGVLGGVAGNVAISALDPAKYLDKADHLVAAILDGVAKTYREGGDQRYLEGGYAAIMEAIRILLRKNERDLADLLARAVSKKAFGAEFSRPIRIGSANDMLDTHNYAMDFAARANSCEFFFDADRTEYRKFIGEVMALAAHADHWPVFGYIGVRFMPKAEAFMAMQRFTNSVSVEVTTMLARQGPYHDRFVGEVHKLARSAKYLRLGQAIPHWGQEFAHDGPQLARLYKDQFPHWHRVMNSMAASHRDRFRSEFSESTGLSRIK